MITTIISFIFVLGVLIFVHELGHFLMARRIGVRVLTFSLGFGPKLISFKRGDTEYCVSAIPLGGYVKMAGENPEDSRTGAPDEFLSKSKWQRFQVLVMGPVMNIVLALVVMTFVFYQEAQLPEFDIQPVVVGQVLDKSAAQQAGIQVGDRIISINNEPVEDWEAFPMIIGTLANRNVPVIIERNGSTIETRVTPTAVGKFEIGDIGIRPAMHPEAAEVFQGGAAQEAGMRVGDVVMGAAGQANVSYEKLVETIRAYDQKPLVLDVKRDGQMQQITVVPRKGDAGHAVVGVRFSAYELRTVNPGPIEAMKLSWQQNWDWARMILKTLAGLFKGDTPVKQLMGPVGIAEMSGAAASAGLVSLFTLMAMISLNLGLINLMPVPVLDGGHITILALEGLSRRDFSMKVKEKMLLVGFVLLVMLMVTVIYNDLTRVEWIERLMIWR